MEGENQEQFVRIDGAKKRGVFIRASTQNRLQARKECLLVELEAISDAMRLFADHPEIQDALDLLGQISI